MLPCERGIIPHRLQLTIHLYPWAPRGDMTWASHSADTVNYTETECKIQPYQPHLETNILGSVVLLKKPCHWSRFPSPGMTGGTSLPNVDVFRWSRMLCDWHSVDSGCLGILIVEECGVHTLIPCSRSSTHVTPRSLFFWLGSRIFCRSCIMRYRLRNGKSPFRHVLNQTSCVIIRAPQVLRVPYRNQCVFLSVCRSVHKFVFRLLHLCYCSYRLQTVYVHSPLRVGVHWYVYSDPVTFDLEAVTLTLKILFHPLCSGYWSYSL